MKSLFVMLKGGSFLIKEPPFFVLYPTICSEPYSTTNFFFTKPLAVFNLMKLEFNS